MTTLLADLPAPDARQAAFDDMLKALTRCVGIIEEYLDETISDSDWALKASLVSDDAIAVIARAKAIKGEAQ